MERYGGNLDARFGGLSAWGQIVHERLAGLPRTGFEVEAGWRIVLGDLADPSDLLPAIQPVIRLKRLDLTLEYAFHDIAASRAIRHDEALATLRVQF